MSINASNYELEVINPGDRASALAHQVNIDSYKNCPAVLIVPHQPGNFRGPVGYIWRPEILRAMLEKLQLSDSGEEVVNWGMIGAVENDGAGGKGQFLTLSNKLEAWRNFGWEIITMTADDLARSGRFPAIMSNEINVRNINENNFAIMEAIFLGYGEALRQSHLVNITGETAVMTNSVTAFCDINSKEQLVVTWGGHVWGWLIVKP